MNINKKWKINDLYNIGDEELLRMIKEKGTSRGKVIVNNLLSRKLMKPVYGLKYAGDTLGRSDIVQTKKVLKHMRIDKLRNEAEITLEKQNFLPEGSVVIYCPGKGMGAKQVETLVDLGSEMIGPLFKIAPTRVKQEMLSSIVDKHAELWKMYVLVDKDLDVITRCQIQGDCSKMFKLQNQVNECSTYLDNSHLHYLLRYEDKYIEDFPNSKRKSNNEVLAYNERPSSPQSEEFVDYSSILYEDYCKTRVDIG